MDNIKIEVIKKLEDLIIITNNELDFILVEDLLNEFNYFFNFDGFSKNFIKKQILNYLKNQIKLNINYISKVIKKYNKRAYIGIKWKDNIKNINIDNNQNKGFNNIYNLKILLENKNERDLFLNYVDENIVNINWLPINLIFYLRVLFSDFKFENKIDFINKNNKIMKNKIIKKIVNNDVLENFNIFLKETLIQTENKTDILYSNDILIKYNQITNIEIENKDLFTKSIKLYVLQNFCNNDLTLFENKYYYRHKKRGYRFLKLKDIA